MQTIQGHGVSAAGRGKPRARPQAARCDCKNTRGAAAGGRWGPAAFPAQHGHPAHSRSGGGARATACKTHRWRGSRGLGLGGGAVSSWVGHDATDGVQRSRSCRAVVCGQGARTDGSGDLLPHRSGERLLRVGVRAEGSGGRCGGLAGPHGHHKVRAPASAAEPPAGRARERQAERPRTSTDIPQHKIQVPAQA